MMSLIKRAIRSVRPFSIRLNPKSVPRDVIVWLSGMCLLVCFVLADAVAPERVRPLSSLLSMAFRTAQVTLFVGLCLQMMFFGITGKSLFRQISALTWMAAMQALLSTPPGHSFLLFVAQNQQTSFAVLLAILAAVFSLRIAHERKAVTQECVTVTQECVTTQGSLPPIANIRLSDTQKFEGARFTKLAMHCSVRPSIQRTWM
jgi:hypothetical protein